MKPIVAVLLAAAIAASAAEAQPTQPEILTDVADLRCKTIEDLVAVKKNPDRLNKLVATRACGAFQAELAYVTKRLTVDGWRFRCLRSTNETVCQWSEERM